MNQSSERDTAPGRLVFLDAQVYLDTGPPVEGHARDVSLSGLFLDTPHPLTAGSRVKVTMTIDNGIDRATIDCPGVVSCLNYHGVAIKLKLKDIDDNSLTHAYHLIRQAAVETLRLEEAREQHILSLAISRAASLKDADTF